MDIANISSFLPYFENVRQRTMRAVHCIPADKLEWSYAQGKFTLGDLARHIVITERYAFVECAMGGKSKYPGCGREFADGYDAVLELLNRLHAEAVGMLTTLSDDDLRRKTSSPSGVPITTWKLLRAMIEHEIHHRGELYAALGVIGVVVPPLYGVTSEQLRDFTAAK